MSEVLKEVNLQSFKEEVLDCPDPVLVDFYASWCNPCKKVFQLLDKIRQASNKIKIVKINIEESSELASNYMVMSIPAIILFKAGKPQEKIVGMVSEREILKMISRHI
ncbi:MAG: thioredoxin [Candidatus Omnitrophica bacterium]|nr:thioredoxin [Candidatus Omnitrophota bacterium]